MPKAKPSSLSRSHNTKAEREARTAAEESMIPKTLLTSKPPAELNGHKVASQVWKRLIKLYDETEGTIITSFDSDVLVKYCLAEEELVELSALRRVIFQMWDKHLKILNTINPKADQLKDYFNALAQANALLQRFQGMDARLDGKRKLIYALAQSLYLTPRSRAGVAPTEKEPDEPGGEIEKYI
jgi:phage terminase small subunit